MAEINIWKQIIKENIAFAMDCTQSMHSKIENAKQVSKVLLYVYPVQANPVYKCIYVDSRSN